MKISVVQLQGPTATPIPTLLSLMISLLAAMVSNKVIELYINSSESVSVV